MTDRIVLAKTYQTHRTRANEAHMRRDGALQTMHAARAHNIAQRFAEMMGTTTDLAVKEIREILLGKHHELATPA